MIAECKSLQKMQNDSPSNPPIKHGRAPKCQWRDKSVITLNN